MFVYGTYKHTKSDIHTQFLENELAELYGWGQVEDEQNYYEHEMIKKIWERKITQHSPFCLCEVS